jgi:hypothetical protein
MSAVFASHSIHISDGHGLTATAAFALQEDSDCLNKVQERFDVDIKPLPASIDTSTYMNQS